MQPAICLLSVVPVRSEPSHRSEMVSQLLFGEYATIGEEKDDFVAVKCHYDGYEGWVQATQLTPITEKEKQSTDEYIGTFSEEVFVDGVSRMMPFGTPIYPNENPFEPVEFSQRKIIYNVLDTAVWKLSEPGFSEAGLDQIISTYIDTPYLWGGKSVYGTDCSGFVQQAFKLFGVNLLRDAYLQAGQGTAVSSLDDAALGDLVFFQNEKGRVMHVGILLNNRGIVHASGKVRIDVVDKDGIINQETGKRTHHFHSIRRFF